MKEDEDDIYSDPELVEDFLQKVLWPTLGWGENSVAFLTERSDLTDFFGPGMTDEEYAQVKEAVKCQFGVELLDRDNYYIADIIRRLREAKNSAN
jgi:hypothetical protein